MEAPFALRQYKRPSRTQRPSAIQAPFYKTDALLQYRRPSTIQAPSLNTGALLQTRRPSTIQAPFYKTGALTQALFYYAGVLLQSRQAPFHSTSVLLQYRRPSTKQAPFYNTGALLRDKRPSTIHPQRNTAHTSQSIPTRASRPRNVPNFTTNAAKVRPNAGQGAARCSKVSPKSLSRVTKEFPRLPRGAQETHRSTKKSAKTALRTPRENPGKTKSKNIKNSRETSPQEGKCQ